MIYSTIVGSTTAGGGSSTIVINNITGVYNLGITNDTDAFTSGGVVFSGSNLTFGTFVDGATQYIQATAGIGGVAVAAGTGTGAGTITNSTLMFSNSNGIAFGVVGSTITAEHNAYYASSQLTNTFANNTHSHGNPTLDLSLISGATASASNGFTISLTGALGVQSINGVSGSISFHEGTFINISQNLNDFTFELQDTSAITSLGFPKADTTKFAGSGFSTGAITGTEFKGTQNSNGLSVLIPSFITTYVPGGGVLSFSAGSSSDTLASIIFSNDNGVTFGLDGSTITASVDYPEIAEIGGISCYLGTLNLSNNSTNNVTLGLSYDATLESIYLSASASYPAQSVQPAIAGIVIGNSTYTSGNVSFSNLNGISFGSNGEGVVTASYTVPAIPGATVFSNSNNINFGLAGSTITASATGLAVAGHTHSDLYPKASFNTSSTSGVAINGSANSDGISLWIPPYITTYAAGGGLIAFSAGTSSDDLASIVFSNSNNVSFGLNGSTVTASASYTQPGATVFSNSNNITFGLNGSTITASATVAATTYPSVQSFNGVSGQLTFNAGSFIGLSQTSNSFTINISDTSAITSAAFPSANTTKFAGPGTSSTTTSGVDLKFTQNSLGLSYAQPVYITTYATQTLQPIGISGSNTSTTVSTISFGASNSFDFYLTNGSIVGKFTESTHGHTYVGSISTGLTGASWTMNSSQFSLNVPQGSLYFGDGSGVTFGIASAGLASTVTASINPAVTTANYAGTGLSLGTTGGTELKATLNTTGLTISYPNFIGSSFITTATAGTAVLGTLDTAGLKLAVPAYLTLAGAGGGDWSISATNGTNILITTGAATNTLYQPGFITGYTESTHSFTQYVGLTSTAITGGSATIASDQLLINIPSNAGSLGFNDSNGVTFGVASTTSNSSSIITASIADYIGVATSITTTSGTDLKVTAGTGGLNIAHPAWLTVAVGGGGEWSVATTNSGTDIIISTATDTNTLYHPAFITAFTAATGGAINFSAAGSSNNLDAVIFSNSNNVSFTLDGSTIVASASYVAGGSVDWATSAIVGTGISIVTGAATNTLQYGPFITGYTESTHAFTQYVGLTSTAITGGSATIASNQLLINIPSNAGSLGFADSNGVTFGIASTASNSSTVVTASVNTVGGGGGTGTTITGNASITLGTAGMSFDGSGLAGTTTAVTGRASITLNSSGLQFNGTGLVGVSTYITGNAAISLNSNGMSFNGTSLAGTTTAVTGRASITLNSSGLQFNGSGLAGTNTGATNCAITVNSSGVSVYGTVGSGTTLGTTAGTAMAVTLNTAGINITYPAVGYLSLVNSNGYSWSTSSNGVSTAIWLVLGHTA